MIREKVVDPKQMREAILANLLNEVQYLAENHLDNDYTRAMEIVQAACENYIESSNFHEEPVK